MLNERPFRRQMLCEWNSKLKRGSRTLDPKLGNEVTQTLGHQGSRVQSLSNQDVNRIGSGTRCSPKVDSKLNFGLESQQTTLELWLGL